MLCNRLKDVLVKKLSVDQAAYRPTFSTEDHLLTTTLLVERAAEWGMDLWLGLVDFEKAFDSVEHLSLWKTMEEQEVNGEYINILKSLYRNQTATVNSGKDSRQFAISRGVKQGDPISALLFSAVMEEIFQRLKRKWRRLNERRKGAYHNKRHDY